LGQGNRDVVNSGHFSVRGCTFLLMIVVELNLSRTMFTGWFCFIFDRFILCYKMFICWIFVFFIVYVLDIACHAMLYRITSYESKYFQLS